MRSGAAFSGELAAGHLIGERYRVESTLGHGGMGAVYRVTDQRDDRQVALKLLHPPRQDQALLVEHFEREYHTLCQLAHPSIIEVYDYGVVDGAAFYTMELLPGQDLRERGTLPWREACPLLRDVASSLAILHSRRLIHRDISARNVRCTEAGRAKLIDFGAMSPMGVIKHVVGTPPFLPPEALRLQVMDGRSDLYALGALAYWTLTGRYPYPARNLEQLPETWRTPPPAPRQYQPDIPEPLERLVMELLELEPSARPSTAAEVMERLCGVAGLPLTELPGVSRAYLVAPMLVGREGLQQALRQKLQQAFQGRAGCSVLLEGGSGTGRTRMLAASVLEAKLLGSLVLQADPGDSSAGDYGVAKSLCKQLLHALPVLAPQLALPWQATLAALVPEFRSAPLATSNRPAAATPPVAPERRTLQAALRDFFLAVARVKSLAIAVDDLDSVDEPSVAFLAMLAHRAKRRPLALLLTLESGETTTTANAALGLLREVAETFALTPLAHEQTAALLRSVFGEVEHITALSERVHQLSGGNPGWTMSLAERLVERGVARYEAGSWQLPSQIGQNDLPDSLTAALLARIESLPSDARELAETLALTDPALLTVNDYPQLVPDAAAESGRLHRALDALTLASVLARTGDRFRFTSHELDDLLRKGVPEQRAREMHARIARALERHQNPALKAHHLLLAGEERAAIETLCAMPEASPTEARLIDDVFERGLLAAEHLGLPRSIQVQLRTRVVVLASERGHYARFTRYIGTLLRELEQASGLADFEATDPSHPLPERFQAAQASAAQRNDARDAADRTVSPQEALHILIRLCGASCSMAAISQSLRLVSTLPRFSEVAPLAFDFQMIDALVAIQVHMQSGRFERARAGSVELIEQLDKARVGRPAGDYRNLVRYSQLYMLGSFASLYGRDAAKQWVAELEQVPGYRSNAWRVRLVYELMLGNADAANICRQRAELFNLQDSGKEIFPGSTARLELQANIYTDDIIGLKRSIECIEGLAALYPGWQTTLDIARCHYRRVQGDYEGALRTLAPALRSAVPCEHFDFGLAVTAEVSLLSALGRHEEAVERGMTAMAISEREELSAALHMLQRVTADALARAGRADEAEALADAHVARLQALNGRGIQLGLAYETRARVAIVKGDEAALRKYAKLCSDEYRGGRSVSLQAKYKRLMRDADTAGMAVTTTFAAAESKDLGRVTQLRTASSMLHTASSRLLNCTSDDERAYEALRLLLEAVGGVQGYLYNVRGTELEFLTSTAATETPPPDLTATLAARVQRELAPDVESTTFQTEVVSQSAQAFFDSSGREFEPLLLFRRRGRNDDLAAIAAIHYPLEGRMPIAREALDLLVAALTEHSILISPEPEAAL